MSSVSNKEWDQFKEMTSQYDFNVLRGSFNEFYGLSFENLRRIIGDEKFYHYAFDTWKQTEWDLYQKFIVDLYTANFC